MPGIGSIIFILLSSLKITASVDYTTVQLYEPFRIRVTVEGTDVRKAPEPTPPPMKNSEITGTQTSQSSQIIFTNGRMSSKVTLEYAYTLIPKKIGTFRIDPFTIRFKGKEYRTEPFEITVVKPKTSVNIPQKRTGVETEKKGKEEKTLFLRTIISKNRLYQGEGVIVTYKLYTLTDIADMKILSIPDFSSFWKEDLFTAKKLDLRKEVYNGRVYYTEILFKKLLFPNTTGKIKIPGIAVSIQVPSEDIFDLFGGRVYNLASPDREITVLPLPSPQPQDFYGGVGKFTMKTYMEKDTVMEGEGANLVVEIKGSGNIKFLLPPEIKNIPGIKIYKPEEETSVKPSGELEVGIKKFKFLVVPIMTGIRELPRITYSYFDPIKQRYVRLKSSPGKIIITPGIVKGKEVSKEKIGSDIAYIKTDLKDLKSFSILPKGILFIFIIFIFPPVVALFLSRERRKIEKDRGYARLKVLPGITKRRFKQMKRCLETGDREGFFETLHRLLLELVKHRFNIESFGMKLEDIEESMIKRGVPEDNIKNFSNLLHFCETVRFQPGGLEGADLRETYERTRRVVDDLL